VRFVSRHWRTEELRLFMEGERLSMSITTENVVQRIAVCYPTESLSGQVAQWAEGRDDCRIAPVFDRSAMAIRRSLDGADIALVDASDDHEQAIDLYSQAVARLGARKASVYTERMHEGLELFVRTHGSWLLLGPLTGEQWDDYFAGMLTESRDWPVEHQSARRRAA
jgi:hypothetical protein